MEKEKNFFSQLNKKMGQIPKIQKTKQYYNWSGPGYDRRDPELVESVTKKLIIKNGWGKIIASERIKANWLEIVGTKIAEHSEVLKVEDKTIYLKAISTAWSTQLKLMQPEIIFKVNKIIGQNTIKSLKIFGPNSISWKKGFKHVSGRGPRDTYG